MKCRKSAGYTIVEVLVVMTITGVLFISVALLFDGRQEQTEVNNVARTLESRLQTTASDVANGNYSSGFTCTAGAATVDLTNTPREAGTSLGCIFLGKVVNFHEEEADIITIVGRQYKAGSVNTDVKTLDEAAPHVVDIGNTTQTFPYTYGAEILKAVSIADDITVYKAIGFMNELGGGASLGVTASGSRSVQLYGIPGSASTNTTSPNDIFDGGTLERINEGVRLCFNGGNNDKFEVTIGAGGDQTITNVLIGRGVSDVCWDA